MKFFPCTDASNNLLTGELADLSSSTPSGVKLICTFLSGFTGTSQCTVQYGTDPTYMNLPYFAESTETGTAGDTVSVVLREQLNSSTVYYYTVSAVSGDIIVTVQGTFVTPLYSKQGNNVSLLLTVNCINVYCIHIYTCTFLPISVSSTTPNCYAFMQATVYCCLLCVSLMLTMNVQPCKFIVHTTCM